MSENKKDEIPDLDFKIENVVGTVTVDIEGRLDLVKIAKNLPDVEYNPERFPGIILRIDKPKATFLIFSTGKMVITGLRKAIEAEKAVAKAVKKIKGAGIKISNPQVKIVNIVASGDLHVAVDLNAATILMEYAMYEPEVFPGLIYRIQDPKSVFLIFSTGKIVCTGVKDEKTAKRAVMKLYKQIQDLNLTKRGEYEEEFQDLTFI
ncbi:MAG: TATA-box-binding protein [Promethearchaeota archaeon]